jgi:hypothetical protein
MEWTQKVRHLKRGQFSEGELNAEGSASIHARDKVYNRQAHAFGEDVSARAREVKIRRTIFYRWKDSYRKGGAFRVKRGRPPKPGPVIEASFKAALDLATANRRAEA